MLERHAPDLHQGDPIEIGTGRGQITGTLAKIYPEITGGRVLADVSVPDLRAPFIGQRVAVRLPLRVREAILVPRAALSTRGGLDFVTVLGPPNSPVARVVLPGPPVQIDGTEMVEILSGLEMGERVAVDD